MFFWEYRKLSLPFEEGQSFFCLCLGLPDHSIITGTLGWMKEMRDQLKPFDCRGASSVEIAKIKSSTHPKCRTKAKVSLRVRVVEPYCQGPSSLTTH